MIQALTKILNPTVPFPRSYWVIPGLLLAGEFPGARDENEAGQKLKALADAGIRHVVNLMEERETDRAGKPFEPYNTVLEELGRGRGAEISCVRFPVPDLGVPSPETMRDVLNSIDEAIRVGKPAYVHCWGGVGRTGTAVGCFLVRHGMADDSNVLYAIRRLRKNDPTASRPSPETAAQAGMARSWSRYETGGPSSLARFTGCMLGGGVGDALGAPVEFMGLNTIRDRFGPSGLTDYHRAYGRAGAVTDDTQMAMFTAEGILLGASGGAGDRDGSGRMLSAVYAAYVRWLNTQGDSSRSAFDQNRDGWLVELPELRSSRAPGNSCLSALRKAEAGTVRKPINDSKGCGGVMRIAPAGLFIDDPEKAFDLGCEIAAITHGHPSGYLASGCLAALVCVLKAGGGLKESAGLALDILKGRPKSEECAIAVSLAMKTAEKPRLAPETVETLGGGWIAEEALAISLCCALRHEDDFAKGVLLAVNHGGDSDSTGAIAGNILGCLLGRGAIPVDWIERLELKEAVEALGVCLFRGRKPI